MSTAHTGATGYTPEVRVGTGNPEAEKYGRMWQHPEYRAVAPGEGLAPTFLAVAKPPQGAHVLDLGCGTGRGALMLALLGGLRVTLVDFVRNCLDEEVAQALVTQPHALAFCKADLEQPLPVTAPYGYCTDVLEHIPPASVDRVLDHVLMAAQHVFLAISTVEDSCGALIGEPLHLSVHPAAWWLEQLQRREVAIHWSETQADRVLIYCSAWRTGEEVTKLGELNTEDAVLLANVRHNIAQGYQQVTPHPPNTMEVAILGGGPSLNGQLDAIRALKAEGAKIVTLNAAYGWAVARGLAPLSTLMVDARAFNARFPRPVRDDCMYFIASQCDPSVYDGLPRDRTWQWHTNPGLVHDLLTAQFPDGWVSVPGGSTVLLRAIPLLRMLGYRRMHLFGCDSCLQPLGGNLGAGTVRLAHHAYAQPENDEASVFPVMVGDRLFHCHLWQISQAQEFMGVIQMLGDEVELAVHGDGLLAYMLETGARIQDAADAAAITKEV